MTYIMNSSSKLRVLFFVFTLSGFAGLIYESIWSRYLGLFLGHAAYAQTLVLSIFMGGMALGAWLCSWQSSRWPNLLRGYAIVEGVIGLFALVFHEVSTAWLTVFFESLVPHMASLELITALKWGSAAFLILPQSILLGMTFPLMSGGIIRRYPERQGRTLAVLYFCNSLGGVAGVLTSGFVLIGSVGLPGTIRISGAINLALAIFVWLVAPQRESTISKPGVASAMVGKESSGTLVLLLLAFLTGTASFIYEVGWIRMLSMVLGSSTHSFELMLSAFILGLALGGLWIRNRIDEILDPVRFLAMVQVFMGIFALATLSVYGGTFPLMQWILHYLPKSDYGYFVYSLANHGVALLVMLPATFCAGMTLPLITHILLKESVGERSIGLVYSANTLGAILGVLFAVHIGMPFFGLKNLIVSGASIDIGLGMLLLISFHGIRQRWPVAICSCGIVLAAINLGWVEFDTYRMASGVFRRAQRSLDLAAGDLIVSHFDGKTASIATVWEGTTITIRTNGKVDASVNRISSEGPTQDEPTMVLSGALPILLHPDAKTAANIGLGSGLSSQLLLMSPKLSRLDTIEIEEGMIEAAKRIRPRNELVFTDPRSHIHIEDAKTFFSTRQQKYDIIVSEPSNPWISGVAGLFSTQFYDLISRNLNPGGIFLQWLQIYEIDVPLVVSVLKALSPRFTDYQIYAIGVADILIVVRNGAIPVPDPMLFRDNPTLTAELRRVGIGSADDLAIRRIASKKLLEPWLGRSRVPANSDYYPRLDVGADRARFRELHAKAFFFLKQVPLPVVEMLEGLNNSEVWANVMPEPKSSLTRRTFVARHVYEYLRNGAEIQTLHADPTVRADARKLINHCNLARSESEKLSAFFIVGANISLHIPPSEHALFWRKAEDLGCARDMASERKLWIELFKAVGRRDAKLMAQTADELLEKNPTSIQIPYLFTAALLGHQAQGHRRQLETLAARYDRTAFGAEWGLVVDVLLAYGLRN